jgi:transcriptional regulator with XRE-family HTH domain
MPPPSESADPPHAGQLLAEWRKRRRLSQLELALSAGLSGRHLRALEAGHARASRNVLMELCDLLRLSPQETDEVLVAAGLTPQRSGHGVDDDGLAQAMDVIRRLSARHDPFPAAVFDHRWDILMVNRGYASLLASLPAIDQPLAALELMPAPRLNLLSLLAAPDGFRLLLSNAPEVLRATLGRVRRELAARDADPALLALVRLWLADPYIADAVSETAGRSEALVPWHLHREGRQAFFVSTLSTLETARTATLQGLCIHQLHAVDDAAQGWFPRN